jgi:hypothetical protein
MCLVVSASSSYVGSEGNGTSRKTALAVAISPAIAAYTLVDKLGIRYANPVTYRDSA